jgi:hypothetical protein
VLSFNVLCNVLFACGCRVLSLALLLLLLATAAGFALKEVSCTAQI